MAYFDGLTEVGKQRYQEVKEAGLAAYYQFEVGNVIIPEEDLRNGKLGVDLFAFLKEHQDWVLGYERYGDDPGIYFLNTIDGLF